MGLAGGRSLFSTVSTPFVTLRRYTRHMMHDRAEATHDYPSGIGDVSDEYLPTCPAGDGQRWEIHRLVYRRARISLTDGFIVNDNY